MAKRPPPSHKALNPPPSTSPLHQHHQRLRMAFSSPADASVFRAVNARELVAEVRALLERALLANSRITRRRAQHLPQLPQSSLQQTKTLGSAPRLRSGISKSPVLAPQSPSPTLQLPPTTNIG